MLKLLDFNNMSLELFLLVVLCLNGVWSTPLSWTQLLTISIVPPARWGAGICATDTNSGYLFGGEGTPANGILGDTWSFTVNGGSVTWSEVTTSGPAPRYGFVSGVVDQYCIISHGCNNVTCFSDTWALNMMSETWSLLVNSSTQEAPRGRTTTAGGVYPGGSDLWLSMGENNARFKRKFSDTWILHVNTTGAMLSAVWEEVSPGGGLDQYAPFLPHARSLHAGAPLSPDTFTIFGGCAGGGQVGGPCPLNDVWTISLTGNNNRVWEQYPLCALGRTRAVLAPIPDSSGNGFLLGGSESYGPGIFSQQLITSEVNASEVFLLTRVNPTNQSWQRVGVADYPENLDSPSVAVTPSGSVYYFGGRRLQDGAFQNVMWMLSGNGEGEPDLGCQAPQYTYLHLHGTLMYAAWGLFFPLGVLLGRYYRWTWPCWFILHVLLQCFGVLVTVAGFVIVFLVGTYSEPVSPHSIVGIVLTALMIQQFLSGIFHPCVDKEDGKTAPEEKSTYRKCWEIYHAISGFLTIAIGLGQVTLGVFLINAPLVVWALWAGLGGLWVLVFIIHECVYVCCKIVHRGKKV